MAAELTPDCLAWLPVAERVLAGDYRDCDETTRESLSIGLRGIEHERCKAALVGLWRKGVPEKHRRVWVLEEICRNSAAEIQQLNSSEQENEEEIRI